MSDLEKLENAVLAHRYLYYVLHTPLLDDHQYDLLERDARAQLPEYSAINDVGSDNEEDYPMTAILYARRLLRESNVR